MMFTPVILAAAALACGDVTTPIPLARNLPTVDGVIGEHEYDEGVRYCGFLKAASENRLHAQGDGTATFLTDGERLFVAWRVKARNVDFDGGLRTSVRASVRDGKVYDDDSVELAVCGDDPNRIAHFIFNVDGAIHDLLAKAGDNNAPMDVKWNCDGVVVKSKVNRGWWECEAMVPFKSIGSVKNGFSANACKCGPGIGAMSVTAAHQHIQGTRIPFKVVEGAPAVHLESIGEPRDGVWAPKVKITSGRPGVRYEVQAEVREVGAASAAFAQSKTIAVGEEFAAEYTTRSRKPQEMIVRVKESGTDAVLYERRLTAQRVVGGGDVPLTTEKELPGFGEVQVYDYPGLNKVRVNFYPENPKASAVVSVGGCDFPLVQSGKKLTVLADVPETPGEYLLSIAGKPVCTLKRQKWEWQGHSLGKDRVLLPPFKKIEASGARAKVLLREYDFKGAGLLGSLIAKDRELLAAPMRFEAIVAGRRVVLSEGETKVEVSTDGLDAKITGFAAADNGLRVDVDGTLEYDGFFYGRFSLSGLNGRQVERLTLVMPMKDAEVPLMHVCMADSIRANPAGRIRAGEGVVWEGTELVRSARPDWNMYELQAVPYVWVGAERRGLSWFINNTCGMKLNTRQSAVRMRREKGVMNVECDIVNVPSALREGHQFAFGYQATPVKLPDPAMRREYQTEQAAHPEGMVTRQTVPGNMMGFWNSWARRPYGDDWRIFDALMGVMSTGTGYAELKTLAKTIYAEQEKPLEAYCKPLADVGTTPHFLWFKSCRQNRLDYMGKLPGKVVPFKYSDPTLNWSYSEEQAAFNAEWVSRGNGYTAAARNFLTPSYLDFIIYYYAKEIKKGLTGVYFDDMFPMTARNPDVCCQVDDEGRSHGNFGLLEMRELGKRVAVVQHLAGCCPRLMQVHMTNCLLVPCFAFATSQLSWEDHFGETEFQTRFKDDYVRAESMGGQIGAEAVALDGIKPKQSNWKSPEWAKRLRFLTRTQQAMLLPAGVKTWERSPWPPKSGLDEEELFKIMAIPGRFGAWETDCAFIPFYEYDGSLGSVPKEVHVGLWKRAGKWLAVLGNQSGADVTLTFAGRKVTIPAYDLTFVEGDFQNLEAHAPSAQSHVFKVADSDFRQGRWTEPKVGLDAWKGRKVAFLGDSITDPIHVGCTSNYWNFLIDDLALDAKVLGVNGDTWLGALKQIARLHEAKSFTDVDAIFVLLGTNDYMSGVPLGELFTYDMESANRHGEQVVLKKRSFNFDRTTFYGRVNAVLQRLKTDFPDAQIILITPPHRGFFTCCKTNVQPPESYANPNGNFLDEYVDALQASARYWSVPVIDLYGESGLVPENDSYIQYFANSKTDRLHPNTRGHRRMADLIEARLNVLPAGSRR